MQIFDSIEDGSWQVPWRPSCQQALIEGNETIRQTILTLH